MLVAIQLIKYFCFPIEPVNDFSFSKDFTSFSDLPNEEFLAKEKNKNNLFFGNLCDFLSIDKTIDFVNKIDLVDDDPLDAFYLSDYFFLKSSDYSRFLHDDYYKIHDYYLSEHDSGYGYLRFGYFEYPWLLRSPLSDGSALSYVGDFGATKCDEQGDLFGEEATFETRPSILISLDGVPNKPVESSPGEFDF